MSVQIGKIYFIVLRMLLATLPKHSKDIYTHSKNENDIKMANQKVLFVILKTLVIRFSMRDYLMQTQIFVKCFCCVY